ncbi:MAG TPA: pectinesterase family protein [Tepidisphaeraceae bacterium]|jgi:pectinesterase
MQFGHKRGLSSFSFPCAIALAALTYLSQPLLAADYYVDPNYAGVNGAPFNGYAGAYNTVAAALGSSGIPSGASAANPNRLFFAPGVYNTANVTGVSLSNSRNNIALIGLTNNPDDVVITSTLDSTYNPGSGALGTTGSSTLQLKGSNTTAVNITFANSTNTPYIVNVAHQAVSPQGNYATGQSQTANSPAVALLLQGDQQAFQNCKFLGYQDTLYTKGGRAYFKDCLVSGDIDFIFANGTSVFKNSTINLDGDHPGGTITAASTDKRTSNGLVFLNSTITGNSVKGNPVIDPQNAANASGPSANNMYLGRPWGWQQTGGDASTVFINTKMTPAIRALGWLNWNANELNAANGKNDGNPAKDTRYAEFNSMDLVGNPLDVSGRVAWQHQLTPAQAAAFTEANLFAFEDPSQFPWFGQGYAGSADPTDPAYSWPAFWGNRNSNNDTANSIVSAVYPAPGNPSAYSNPSWIIPGAWDPNAQLSTVPEPASIGLIVFATSVISRRRRA